MLALDQFTKWLVRRRSGPPFVSDRRFVRVRRANTTRPSFRRLGGRVSLVATWVVALACVLALMATGTGPETWAGRAGVGAALGGAAGNLMDILRRQAVTDFIDLGWWPVFNLADVGIVCGLAMAFWPVP